MVNWSDPEVVAGQAAAFVKILLVLLGMYAWELLNTMTFDYNLLVKWKDFKVILLFISTRLCSRVLIHVVNLAV
ncbi:hypothetical protein FRC08_015267 [Ceratobasidium sp. 394]|nr:hypothetical protein FRC08_015267 [Ceratobasidium sp. 394]